MYKSDNGMDLHKIFALSIIFLLPFFRVRFYFSYWFWCTLLVLTYVAINSDKVSKRVFKEALDYLVFLAIAIFSSAINGSLVFFSIGIEYLLAYFIYFLLRNYSGSDVFNSKLAMLLLLQWGIQSLLAYMQFLGDERFYLIDTSYLNDNTNVNLVSAETFTGVRVWGSLYNSLDFSNYMTPVSIYLLVFLFNRYAHLRFSGVIGIVFALASVFVIGLSGSRTGTAIYILLCFLFFYGKSKSYFYLLLATAVGAGMLLLFSSEALQDFSLFQRIQNENLYEDARFQLFANALSIFFRNPFFGVGIGDINEELNRMGVAAGYAPIDSFDHVENLYLTLLVSVGVFGSFFIFRFMLLPVYKYLKSGAKIADEAAIFPYLAMLLAALAEPSTLANTSLFTLFLYYRARVMHFSLGGS